MSLRPMLPVGRVLKSVLIKAQPSSSLELAHPDSFRGPVRPYSFPSSVCLSLFPAPSRFSLFPVPSPLGWSQVTAHPGSFPGLSRPGSLPEVAHPWWALAMAGAFSLTGLHTSRGHWWCPKVMGQLPAPPLSPWCIHYQPFLLGLLFFVII